MFKVHLFLVLLTFNCGLRCPCILVVQYCTSNPLLVAWNHRPLTRGEKRHLIFKWLEMCSFSRDTERREEL
jgi:hypothetical protein